jgi:hypothetical protein
MRCQPSALGIVGADSLTKDNGPNFAAPIVLTGLIKRATANFAVLREILRAFMSSTVSF